MDIKDLIEILKTYPPSMSVMTRVRGKICPLHMADIDVTHVVLEDSLFKIYSESKRAHAEDEKILLIR